MPGLSPGVLLTAEASVPDGLASAVMWDLGANIWSLAGTCRNLLFVSKTNGLRLCQGLLWGVAAVYSPHVQVCGRSCVPTLSA